MTDFDYDAMQKKRIASGAYHRKNGSRSKGCRLPHENLTKKEREALNGEVFTINTLEKVSWERFKTLPATLQTEYLQHLMNNFGVGLMNISADLFGLSKSTLSGYVNSRGLKLTTRTGGHASRAAKASWYRWLNSDPIFAPVNELPEEPEVSEEPKATDVPQVTMCEEDFPTADPMTIAPREDVKPFRAHDFEDLFRDCGMERETEQSDALTDSNAQSDPLTKEKENPYPATDVSLTLKGTPIDILTTLRMSFPTLLDKDRAYRFQIKVDTFVV